MGARSWAIVDTPHWGFDRSFSSMLGYRGVMLLGGRKTLAFGAGVVLSLTVLWTPSAMSASTSLSAGPADGRLRGQDFALTVTKVSWPDSLTGSDGRATLAPPGMRYVTFDYTVALNAQALQPNGSDPMVTAALRVEGRSIPIALDTNNAAADPATPSGWTSGSGESTEAVPNDTHAVDVIVSQGAFSQSLDLWTLRRIPPTPTVLYRDPTLPTLTGTLPGPSTISLANPSDGFVSTATATVQRARLGYFDPSVAVAGSNLPSNAVLTVTLDAESPNNPDDQTASGHFLGAQAPLPGSMLSFTPDGGAPVPATLNDAGDTTGKGSSDDGLFDGTYSFVVPGDLTTGTLTVHAGSFTGAEFTLFTAESGPTTLDITAPVTLPLTFPAVPPAVPQSVPPWVGHPVPATATASSSAATAGRSGGFPIWLAIVIVAVLALGTVLVQRHRRRTGPIAAMANRPPTIEEVPPEPSDTANTQDEIDPDVSTTASPADPGTGTDVGVAVNVLGPVEFAGLQQQSDRRIVYELLAYLACHDGRHLRTGQIQIGMWPVGSAHAEVSEKTLRNYLSELRSCVGAAHLPDATAREGYLLEGVVTDWETFRRLSREAETTDPASAIDLRSEALALVRGRPFEGVAASTYEWVAEEHLDRSENEMSSLATAGPPRTVIDRPIGAPLNSAPCFP